jgi:hypothetical protein
MPVFGYGSVAREPKYITNLQNVDLIAKVLLSKQQEYNTAYQGLQDQQKTALGINFVNKKEQGKIDAFNQKVAKTFEAGEFGDLSDPKTAEKYYALFDEIGRDATLISRYKQDAGYQEQLRAVEEKRQSKDPAKAGFGAINYDNYLSRLQEYSEMDLDSPEAKGYTLRGYTDYVDMSKELGDQMKNIPIKKFSTVELQNGRMITRQYVGRGEEAVSAATQEYMSSRGAAQLREQAEYTFRKAKGDPGFQQAIYNDHVQYNQRAQQQISSELDKTSEDLKRATDPNQIQELSGAQARLESELGKLQTNLLSADDFFSRDQDAIINDLTSIAAQDMVVNTSTAYGKYSVSEKVEPDRAYLEIAKMQQHAQEFQISTDLKERELLLRAEIAGNNDENAKARIAMGLGAKGAGAQGTATVPGSSVQPSYFSDSDKTHVDFGATYEAMQSTVGKLYAKQTNILETGITNGDHPVPAENVALQLAIDPNSMNANEFYNESPYLAAFKFAWDEEHRSGSALSDYLGKTPTDNYGWDRLKEATTKIKTRVNQMMTSPKNKEEAKFANDLQDVNANLLSVTEFMEEANKSGDPAKYVKEAANIKMYSNAAYDFELPADATKEQKQRVNNFHSLFKPSFTNWMGGVDEAKGTQIKYPNFDQIARIETGPDGTLKIFPKPSAYEVVTKGSGEDKEVIADKSGFLATADGYILAKKKTDKGYEYVRQDVKDIKTRGYFELKDPNFNKMNWGNQLGYTVGSKPQQRWDASSDGVSVPFKTRRSTITNQVEAQVNGGEWIPFATTDVTAVIAEVRKAISSRPFAELQPQPTQ